MCAGADTGGWRGGIRPPLTDSELELEICKKLDLSYNIVHI